ncbi:hypothetical protein C8A01DRAFT_46055 [Parachaetomium inaequale]|uniref:Rhodopsin domain-containing protein n=1 Tax=Parachaetomium inaequale TaxID=2588326 RepID=A0AAN6SSQ0_9PEZI|nr:hypothetical protein C8A01DRAFT_46055 [Parachaetomium inaequale]
MRLPPPEVLASWPAPNYTNPQTRGRALIIVELITLPIALICLGLRLYARIHVMGRSEWDDWMMVVAAFFCIGVTTCVVLAYTRYGWDIHVWDLTFDQMVAGRQVSFAAQALFVPATLLAKVSILISYLRLASKDSWFRRMTSDPVTSYWNLMYTQRDCVSELATTMSQAITTAIADFIVWVLPMPALYRAKLPLAQRLALITLFSFGLVVVVAACIRTYWIHYVIEETYDVTWYGFQLWMWTAVEVQLGIICGCVPWLKSLVKFWRNRNVITDLTDKSNPKAGRSRFDGRRATMPKGGTVVRLDSHGTRSTNEDRRPTIDKGAAVEMEKKREQEREREMEMQMQRNRGGAEYVDLESGSGEYLDTAPQTLPPDTPGLAL